MITKASVIHAFDPILDFPQLTQSFSKFHPLFQYYPYDEISPISITKLDLSPEHQIEIQTSMEYKFLNIP